MAHQGYDLQLTRYDEQGWQATSTRAGTEHRDTVPRCEDRMMFRARPYGKAFGTRPEGAPMEAFWENLKSPSWLISVVVVGVIVSWIAAYLKAATDRLGSILSRRWGERTSAKAAARTAMIEELRANRHEQVMTILDVLDDKIHAALNMVMGFIVGMLYAQSSATWVAWIGMLLFLIGFWRLGSGQSKMSLVRAARSSRS